MEDVKAFHPFVSGNNVGRSISFQVADVKTLPAGIGEHVEHIKLRLSGIESRLGRVWRMKGLSIQPTLLPFRLEFQKGKLFSSLAHWYYLVLFHDLVADPRAWVACGCDQPRRRSNFEVVTLRCKHF